MYKGYLIYFLHHVYVLKNKYHDPFFEKQVVDILEKFRQQSGFIRGLNSFKST